MISEGVSPQIARSILPTCLKTEIVVTTNFREWRHILKLRTSSAAHPQIREIMEMALKILKNISPICFEEIK
jgi:thymidylate synthase (FAD)